MSHTEQQCPCAAAKPSTDAQEEGVLWMIQFYGSDWSPQQKAWNKKGFRLPEIVLMNLIIWKLRILIFFKKACGFGGTLRDKCISLKVMFCLT